MRLLYTLQAELDLQHIVEHIAQNDLAAAVEWLDGIEALFALLASQPGLGERMATRRFGEVRRHSTGNYAVYYRVTDDGLGATGTARGS